MVVDKIFSQNMVLKVPKKDIKTLETLVKKKIGRNLNDIKSIDEYLKSISEDNKPSLLKLPPKSELESSIKYILSRLKNSEKEKGFDTTLKSFLSTIDKVDMKKNIKNSGILYESKLKESISQNLDIKRDLENDLKSVLMKIREDHKTSGDTKLLTSIDKAITHIEISQANSLIGSMFYSYIPFSWENLKDGSLSFGKLKEDDKSICKIELDLQKQGKVDMIVVLRGEEISIKFDFEDKSFKEKILQNSSDLKKSLVALSLKPSLFFAKDTKEDKKEFYENQEINMGVSLKA